MRFLGLDIYAGEYTPFLETIKNPTKPTLVFTPNPEILVSAARDVEFLEILKCADICTPDANGLYTGSLIQAGNTITKSLFLTLFSKKKLSHIYGELMPGSRLTGDLVEFAIHSKSKILFIDNYRITEPKNPFEVKKMEVQNTLESRFHEKFPNLHVDIVFDGEKSPEELAKRIQVKDIRFIFSCIGMKKQEKRLVEIFAHLPSSQKVVGLGVGSSFDYLLGLQNRAPEIFQTLGLEWLYRLMQDPFVRWKRIHTALIIFPRLIETQNTSNK